ncbi:hypothetical protein BDF14DRAFT_1916165 [Spinellus fusiger]|nr:hypothetical protein BDF14DRAFT_1916165 [Spinellus fusiger]
MNVYPFQDYPVQRDLPISRYLLKCCGCIHLRTGAGLSGTLWASVSMYFAILSFQGQSVFYSYLIQTPLVIFGVVNLILSVVGVGTLYCVYINKWQAVRASSNAVFVAVFLVIVDSIANAIVFAVKKQDYLNWCITTSSNALGQNKISVQGNTTLLTTTDYYNCTRTWEDELKFGILATFLMVILYVYWAMCIYSYSVKRRHICFREIDMAHGTQQEINPVFPTTVLPPMQYVSSTQPAAPNVIVLNNQKPSKYTSLASPPPTEKYSARHSDLSETQSSLLVLPDDPSLVTSPWRPSK